MNGCGATDAGRRRKASGMEDRKDKGQTIASGLIRVRHKAYNAYG